MPTSADDVIVTVTAPTGNSANPPATSGSAQSTANSTITAVSCQIDGGPLIAVQFNVTGPGTASWTAFALPNQPAGNHLFTAFAADARGKIGCASTNFTI